jgi:RecA/RadA recombinase
MQDLIMKQLGYTVFVKHSQIWLDTGSPNLNKVLGSKRFGLPAGKIYEIRGKKHAGKTAIVMRLASMSQRLLNAFVLWIDAEASLTNESATPDKNFENSWATKLGLDIGPDSFYRIGPKFLKSKKARRKGKKVTKAGVSFLQSAESMFEEVEKAIGIIKEQDPDRPIFIALDSIANLQTEMNVDAGNTNKNMRTHLDRAMFLSDALPRLSAYAANYNCWVFLINQIRTNPTVMFGSNEYSPGGKAIEHNSHIQANMRPMKGGVIIEGGAVVGIRGKIVNVKNKAGGGSLQSQQCLYRVSFNKPYKKMWKYGPLSLKDKKETE